ncbi:hypothetical protein CUC43_25940 [Bacillus thuringiensis LM1212]|uniref:hypothetical protein n=1 Tax=Bacillus cereus group TaxID=86661 RepID=UPI0004000173|nr:MULTISPECIES: hypothetical protein [Bacillus cereus group]AXY09977.1 hypothetical protein CUC43_25940 [Bacillus thuringiensis LM1212]MCU4797694.1 hypothetical protein [Bacillus cereus]QDF22879.1 hypothetical protein FJR70_07510 [Bacillus tropicus]QUG96201.1 hypothetical protein HCM98_15195 [Bacillus tropicus]
MDQVDKEQAVKSVVAMVGKVWGSLKTIIQSIGKEVVTKVRETQPFIQEVQRLETKRAKHRRKVTYRKKKSQAKRKAWKKYGLQGRGRKK